MASFGRHGGQGLPAELLASGGPELAGLRMAVTAGVSVVLAFTIISTWWCLAPLTGGLAFWQRRLRLLLSRRVASLDEDHFATEKEGEVAEFPSLSALADDKIVLSVVLLACDEEARLPVMLDDAIAYLQHRQLTQASFGFEIIVVDNASHDFTASAATRFVHKYGANVVRILRLRYRHDDGAAIRKGVLRTRGKYILVAGAEGFVRLSEYDRLESAMTSLQGEGIVLGSRAHMQLDLRSRGATKVSRMDADSGDAGSANPSPADMTSSTLEHRQGQTSQAPSLACEVAWRIFQVIFQMFCARDIYDPLCPFQLYSRLAAQRVFLRERLDTPAATCERLVLARRFGIPIVERAVQWTSLQECIPPAKISAECARDTLIMVVLRKLNLW
ncbi:Dolichyl-phosphate beta-glucosyltransferase [Hondaea fermentalgiana]|uniref:Dolichyl-phosphate beta-glucosyltransferase n=1 Tax=Hondaea fermentalgiana TaxID=2315210 RepID=A0A2R5G6E9_9STRA|nr:Dolichyl-phosphate beta-glucosyltransferase [Hondaea fermentalgiana]|eukprot:GBG25899.1 Dolichyl-phosphate beta-glucosyltransferase [Hondaea fermentalgiana]